MFFSIIFHELKSFISNNLISQFKIDYPIDLNNKINKIISMSNFDNLLSFYGLNRNSKDKLWNKFLLLIMFIGFLRHFFLFRVYINN